MEESQDLSELAVLLLLEESPGLVVYILHAQAIA